MPSKSKKAVARPESPSENQADPQADAVLEEEVADMETDQSAPSTKKGKVKSGGKRKSAQREGDVDDDPQQAKPPEPKKKRAKKATPPPPVDEEEPEPDEEEEEPEQQDDDDDAEAPEIDPELIDQQIKAYRKEHKKLPPADVLAEALECDEAVAEGILKKKRRAMEKVTNERKAAKIKGYYKGAVSAGYGNIKDTLGASGSGYAMAVARGTDSLKPLLSMSDVLRLATFLPAQPAEASYSAEEFALRLGIADTTLPVDAARELLANADAIFKQTVNRSAAVAMQQRSAQMIKPSHAMSWMKPIAENMMFSSINAPEGLVEYAKSKEVGAIPAIGADAKRKKDNSKSAKTNASAFQDYETLKHEKKTKAAAAREASVEKRGLA
ncbi:MAG: hypothetical protein ACKVI4_14720 [Actinomycetales bacterium]